MKTKTSGYSGRSFIIIICCLLISFVNVFSQMTGVPIYHQKSTILDTNLFAQIEQLKTNGLFLNTEKVQSMLLRTNCQLNLPLAHHRKLIGRDVWQTARSSYLRVGWSYLCNNCDKQHINLAGGYFITTDGAAVTCFHVIKPDTKKMRHGVLVASNDEGKVFAISDILAASEQKDVCIVRIRTSSIPLSLNTEVSPGDPVYVFSDPLGHRGFFSSGIINRFIQLGNISSKSSNQPIRINVSTDWAPGSSGAAVIDQFGNAIGHVSQIETLGVGGNITSTNQTGTCLIVHEAISAKDIKSLITPEKIRKSATIAVPRGMQRR